MEEIMILVRRAREENIILPGEVEIREEVLG